MYIRPIRFCSNRFIEWNTFSHLFPQESRSLKSEFTLVFPLSVLPCVVGTNLVDNPGFETNTGWGPGLGHNVPGDLHYVTSTYTEGGRSLMIDDDSAAQITISLPDR